MKRIRVVITVLLCFTSFLFTSLLSAQNTDQDIPSVSVDIDILYNYLDTADRQQFEQRWLDYARFGITAATSSWEKEVLLVMGKDFDITELRIETDKKLRDIVDTRFADWLNQNFFNTVSVPALGDLNTEIENLNNQYLYDIQADGSLKYKTTENYDDLYTIDTDGNRQLVSAGEKKLWTEGVKTKITELLEGWSERMTTAFADLRSTFTEDRLRNKLEEAYEFSFESYKNAYNNRLYRLYQIEQSRFNRLRLYDQYSLQHESEL